MNIETLHQYCLSLEDVEECFPFDETTLVFKVRGKIFLLTDLEGDFSLNLKCDPALALELREKYPAVTPGYHMNKKHWNTIAVDGSVPDNILLSWIDLSYSLVAGRKKSVKHTAL